MSVGNGSGKRSGLGRGLGALITKTDVENSTAQPAAQQESTGGVMMVAVERITPNPHQPRTHFEHAALEELAASVREHGIIQPLIVTRVAESDELERYWLIAGERRWRAAQLAELSAVPVIVREASARQLMKWALVENIQLSAFQPKFNSPAHHCAVILT